MIIPHFNQQHPIPTTIQQIMIINQPNSLPAQTMPLSFTHTTTRMQNWLEMEMDCKITKITTICSSRCKIEMRNYHQLILTNKFQPNLTTRTNKILTKVIWLLSKNQRSYSAMNRREIILWGSTRWKRRLRCAEIGRFQASANSWTSVHLRMVSMS